MVKVVYGSFEDGEREKEEKSMKRDVKGFVVGGRHCLKYNCVLVISSRTVVAFIATSSEKHPCLRTSLNFLQIDTISIVNRNVYIFVLQVFIFFVCTDEIRGNSKSQYVGEITILKK